MDLAFTLHVVLTPRRLQTLLMPHLRYAAPLWSVSYVVVWTLFPAGEATVRLQAIPSDAKGAQGFSERPEERR